MSLLTPADQQRLRDLFAGMTRPVRLLYFTQAVGCETCLQTRQILDELPPLSDQIAIEEVNFVLDGERAAQYAVDRVPAVAIVYEEDGALKDSRIRFLGTPAGYEFMSLVHAVLLAGGRESALSAENLARLAETARPLAIHVFTTPTCPHCPGAVTLAHEMAFASPHITAYAVEATEFPDLARRYMVTGVPKTVVSAGDGSHPEVEILGALPQDDFVEQALATPPKNP